MKSDLCEVMSCPKTPSPLKGRKNSKASKTIKEKYKRGYINPMKGKKRPDLSEYNKKHKSFQMKGENNPNKRPEVIAKRKKTIEGRTKELYGHSGSKNGRWLGGTSYEPYTYEFNAGLKKKIKKRDSYICQVCSIREKDVKQGLCIHHIDYDKTNNKEYNLVTLCHSCNSKVNHKRQNWTEFFIEKMRTQNYMTQELVWNDIEKDCAEVCEFLRDKNIRKIIAIPRGAIVPGVIIANMLNIDLGFRVTSEDDVIFDEIVDWGITFKKWKKKHPVNLFVCLHFNKNHFSQTTEPDYYVREVSKFIKYPWEVIKK